MPTTTSVTIKTADGDMPAASSAPDGEGKGAIVVFQEAFGITGHIEAITRRLADAGYVSLAPALFHRQGSPVFSYDDYESLLPTIQQLTGDGLTMDIEASLDHVASLGYEGTRTGAVGFCMGGAVALLAATQRRFGAAVTYYGGGVGAGRFGLPSGIELAANLKTPWLGLYGDLDKGIPVEDVELLRAAAEGAPVETEVVRYATADHGFNCDERPSYNAEAAKDAWTRTLAWFDRHLG
jgi:carboxymethylenebutenolidase